MDSEESYIAALKEKARELVETAMKNAQDCFRTLQTAPMDDTDKGKKTLDSKQDSAE